MGMKKNLRCLSWAVGVFVLTSHAYAIGNGFYLGFILGPATVNGKTEMVPVEGTDTQIEIEPKRHQFAGGVLLGNQINQFAAIEGGLTYFSKIRYNTSDSSYKTNASINLVAINVVGKAMLPFYMFTVYGKAGAAATYSTEPINFTASSTGDSSELSSDTKRKLKYAPVAALGASYDLNQNWLVDLSYIFMSVGGKVGRVNMLGLSFSYHFVDKYCGQFLCDD
jgi:opacity protein-like surface antigen